MRQEAPDPQPLDDLVSRLKYKADWRVWLEDLDRGQGSKGLTLIIQRHGPDTYHPEISIRVNHYFPVPPAAYDERSWRRWLFDRLVDVETHEAMEFFVLLDGGQPKRPYAPSHGPGNDPYMIREPDGTELDRRTMYTGEVSDH
jgi:hypothetical protein